MAHAVAPLSPHVPKPTGGHWRGHFWRLRVSVAQEMPRHAWRCHPTRTRRHLGHSPRAEGCRGQRSRISRLGGEGCDGSLWKRLRLLLCVEEDKEWKRLHIATHPQRAQWKCHPPSCETETSYDLAEGWRRSCRSGRDGFPHAGEGGSGDSAPSRSERAALCHRGTRSRQRVPTAAFIPPPPPPLCPQPTLGARLSVPPLCGAKTPPLPPGHAETPTRSQRCVHPCSPLPPLRLCSRACK